MNRYNAGLKEHQNEKRQETIEQIKNAIDTIHALEGDNAIITAHKILIYTSLSRSALYKEHSLKLWNPKLWEERYVEKSRIEKKLEDKYTRELAESNLQSEELRKDILKLQRKIIKLEKDHENERKRREVKELEIMN